MWASSISEVFFGPGDWWSCSLPLAEVIQARHSQTSHVHQWEHANHRTLWGTQVHSSTGWWHIYCVEFHRQADWLAVIRIAHLTDRLHINFAALINLFYSVPKSSITTSNHIWRSVLSTNIAWLSCITESEQERLLGPLNHYMNETLVLIVGKFPGFESVRAALQVRRGWRLTYTMTLNDMRRFVLQVIENFKEEEALQHTRKSSSRPLSLNGAALFSTNQWSHKLLCSAFALKFACSNNRRNSVEVSEKSLDCSIPLRL